MLPSAPPRGFPLVVDGYVIAYVNDDGSLNRCREYKWVKLERQVEFDNATQEIPLGHDSGLAAAVPSQGNKKMEWFIATPFFFDETL